MITKCDFCVYGPNTYPLYCVNKGSGQCEIATERFFQYMKSKNGKTTNKNIRIKKTVKKP